MAKNPPILCIRTLPAPYRAPTRIISFMRIGLLIIVIAYFWPAPPRNQQVEI